MIDPNQHTAEEKQSRDSSINRMLDASEMLKIQTEQLAGQFENIEPLLQNLPDGEIKDDLLKTLTEAKQCIAKGDATALDFHYKRMLKAIEDHAS